MKPPELTPVTLMPDQVTPDKFSPDTVARLARAGWTPAYSRGAAELRATYAAAGHAAPDAAVALLTRFGGLRVPIRHHIAGDEDTFHLDPALALGSCEPDDAAAYAERLGEPALCPVGEVWRDHATLLVAPSGRVYAAFENTVVILAETPLDAIETLCAGRPPLRCL